MGWCWLYAAWTRIPALVDGFPCMAFYLPPLRLWFYTCRVVCVPAFVVRWDTGTPVLPATTPTLHLPPPTPYARTLSPSLCAPWATLYLLPLMRIGLIGRAAGTTQRCCVSLPIQTRIPGLTIPDRIVQLWFGRIRSSLFPGWTGTVDGSLFLSFLLLHVPSQLLFFQRSIQHLLPFGTFPPYVCSFLPPQAASPAYTPLLQQPGSIVVCSRAGGTAVWTAHTYPLFDDRENRRKIILFVQFVVRSPLPAGIFARFNRIGRTLRRELFPNQHYHRTCVYFH